MEPIVDSSEASVVSLHECCAECVVARTGIIEHHIRFERVRKRKCADAVRVGVKKVVLQTRTEETCPALVHSALEHCECSGRLEWEDNSPITDHYPFGQERESESIAYPRD